VILEDPVPVFNMESFEDVLEEAKPLLDRHWELIALRKDKIKLAPDFEKYRELDRAGSLKIATIRVEGRLVGYWVAFLSHHPHYKNDLMALTDIFFLLPEYRSGLLGYRFLEYVEQEMKNLGVVQIMAGTKLHYDLSRLFERLGWTATDMMYAKYIGD